MQTYCISNTMHIKFNYIFAAYLSKSVRFLQNHSILSNIPLGSVSIHKEIGENNDFLQNYNNSKFNFLYKHVMAGKVCNGTKQLIKTGIDTKKTIRPYA